MVIILTTWTKFFIVMCSLGVVAISALLVICFVNPMCLFHRLLPSSVRLENKASVKKVKKGTFNGLSHGPVELTKLTAVAQYDYGSPFSSHYVQEVGLKSPPITSMYTPRRLYHSDSCYSSMSPTIEAGSRPTSPISLASDKTSDSLIMVSPSSPVENEPSVSYGSLNVELQYNILENSNTGHLTITIAEAHNLPGREYCPTTCDPFIKVILLKSRTRLRKSRLHYMTLSEFQTSTVKKTRNPQFNQSFTIELTKTDIKDCTLKYLVFDRDKYANPSTLAEAMLPLLDLKLQSGGDALPLTVELHEARQNNGEILIGLSYLPTSERLSFNVIKAMNLKYDAVTNSIDNLNVEVRIMLLHNGKLIKKKKTSTVAGSNNPNFNYSVSFDIPTAQLDSIVFIVGIAQSCDVVSESDDSLIEKPSRHDNFIGKLFLGSCIQSQSRTLWQAMLMKPRQQVSGWHVLR